MIATQEDCEIQRIRDLGAACEKLQKTLLALNRLEYMQQNLAARSTVLHQRVADANRDVRRLAYGNDIYTA